MYEYKAYCEFIISGGRARQNLYFNGSHKRFGLFEKNPTKTQAYVERILLATLIMRRLSDRAVESG